MKDFEPKKSRKPISLRMDPDLHNWAREQSQRLGITLTQLVEACVRRQFRIQRKLDRKKKKSAKEPISLTPS